MKIIARILLFPIYLLVFSPFLVFFTIYICMFPVFMLIALSKNQSIKWEAESYGRFLRAILKLPYDLFYGDD